MSQSSRFPFPAAPSLFCVAALISAFNLSAQVSLTTLGAAQTQNFDTLATAGTTNPWTDNSVIVGWYATQTAGTLVNYRAGDGSSNTGAIYSFGTGTNVERALGSAASGTPANLIYAARYVNNTGATLTSLLVSYTGEQWRNGGNATAQRLDFSFQVANAGVITAANTPATGWTDVNTLDFTGPIATATAAALDGNLLANQAAPTDTIVLSVAPGQEVWIRWFDSNDVGNDHGFGIDNVSVTPQGAAGSSADLSVTKTDSPDPVNAGSNITYTITATNNGPDSASTVSLNDTLPAGTTFVSLPAVAGWSCTTPTVGTGGTVTCSNPAFAVGSAVFTLTAAVDASLAAGTVISNTATASSTTSDPNAGNQSGTATTTVGTAADLSVTKLDTPDPVVPGNNLTYTITASNAGPSNAASVSLSDILPAGTTFVSLASPGGWSCTTPMMGAGGTISCSIASLPAGSAMFTLTVAVDPATVPGTVLSNTATASSTTTDPNTGNESGTATTTVGAGSADLSVTKTDTPDPVAPGSNLTYTITASNAGPSNAANVSLSDTLPAGTTFVSLASPGSWSCTTPMVGAAGTVSCTAAALASGNAVFTLVVAVDAGVTPGTVLSNTATVSSTTADPSPGNESATATTTVGAGSADLSITKSAAPQPVTAGANLTYTITAANAGPSNAASASISDPLPVGTTFVSLASPGGWSCTTPAVGAGGTVACSLASMPIGSAAFTLVVNVGAAVTGGTVLSNTATVTSATADANPGNESATANSTVSAPALIAGAKTATGNLVPGGSVTYTIVLSNSGSSAQADNPGNEFTDVLPAGLTLVSATASSGTAVATIGTNTVTWNGSVPAAGNVTITINAGINANVVSGSTIINQGTINFDADGNGTNEAVTVTDNPATGAPNDGTGIAVLGIATAVPTLGAWMQILLLASLLLLAAAALRRRMF